MTREGAEGGQGLESTTALLPGNDAAAPHGEALPAAAGGPGTSTATPAAFSGHSRFVQRLRRRYDGLLALLDPGPPTRATLQAAYTALAPHAADTGTRLRMLRQLTLERLACLDCDQQAPLEVVTRAMTELAELALDTALAAVQQELDERHGAPITSDGQRAVLWVVGMGKLGARELNVSSDIDLVYVYDHDGETAGNADGRNRTSNHEYFARAVKAVYQLIGDTTEHGFVFRVDLMLRPNGNSGPPAVSLAALEEYFQVQGREWERFAWLKSRVVAPIAALHHDGPQGEGVQALRSVVLPFVFRRYLDYSVFDALRTLHRQIREQAARRSAGKPDRANDVKLSRGGIREIEFTVQLLQVVRGGQFPELRCRATLEALQRVARAGLMPQDTADALAAAYTFLRRVEHRIQYLDDQQTHVLPTHDGDVAWIAQSMGFAGACPFLHALDAHRELVAQEFDILLGGPPKCEGGSCSPKRCTTAAAPDFESLQDGLPERFGARVALWHTHPRMLGLRDDVRQRLVRLVQRTGEWLAEGRVHEEGAVQLAQWLEQLLRRESYIALLLERPAVHERLLHLLGAAKWPAKYLQQHPGVIDELASDVLFHERFDAAEFEDELARRLRSVAATAEDDDETLLNLLRRAHHAEVFRTLARDVEGVLTTEQVADDLSALADSMLRVTAQWCWQRLRQRHRDEPQFAIIGYGKLGGKELGYGSDLDIVFVFQDDDERAPEAYAALVRKLINWLTVKTGEGDLYEIDTALRPNGSSGLLITSFDAYAGYQQRRGSNTAWTWEHQAMTRARLLSPPASQAATGGEVRPPASQAAPGAACSSPPPAGETQRLLAHDAPSAGGWGCPGADVGGGGAVPALAFAQRFAAVREAVITAPRDAVALAGEIVAMREKLRGAHPVKVGLFDVKHSPGGMVDAEFAVQYLVLAHAAAHPALRDNVGNIALLQRAEAAGLLAPGIGAAAADAYRALRRLQHRARLDEAPTQVPVAAAVTERGAVLALWVAVFGIA